MINGMQIPSQYLSLVSDASVSEFMMFTAIRSTTILDISLLKFYICNFSACCTQACVFCAATSVCFLTSAILKVLSMSVMNSPTPVWVQMSCTGVNTAWIESLPAPAAWQCFPVRRIYAAVHVKHHACLWGRERNVFTGQHCHNAWILRVLHMAPSLSEPSECLFYPLQ